MVEDSQYAMRAKHPATKITVDCETLDNFCQAWGVAQIDVLKVDAEGQDLAILQGAEGLLARRPVKFVFVEFNSMLPRDGATGGALLPISSLLEPFGFNLFYSELPRVHDCRRGIVRDEQCVVPSCSQRTKVKRR
jgi:hypothetical protein